MVVTSVLVLMLTSDVSGICTSVANLHLCYMKTVLLFIQSESSIFSKCIINATRLCQLWSHVKNLKLITRRDHLFFPVGCLPCYLLLYIDRSVTWFYVLTMSGLCQEFRELITSLLHLNKSHHHHHRHHHHAFSFYFLHIIICFSL